MSLLSERDLSRRDVEALLYRADEMRGLLPRGTDIAKHKIVANLFFEPSTRTNYSHQAAALRIGAQVLAFNPAASSVSKGESFEDTIRMFDNYADLLVIRHPQEGAAARAAAVAKHPVVNAGDGGASHPTQMLIDLYTIWRLKHKLSGLNIVLMGDLLHARAMRSLYWGLAMFNSTVTLVSPKSLRMEPAHMKEVESVFGFRAKESERLDITDADILYVCRIQKERFKKKKEAELAARKFRLTREHLKGCKDDLAILHPLPKLDEIAQDIDPLPHAKYFEQAANAVPVRMAILAREFGI
jgi:aspartate carbamoyltransferase catalytic subunit